MKKYALAIVIVITIGLGLASNALEASTLPPPPVEPINTPAAPGYEASTIAQLPSSSAAPGTPQQTRVRVPVAEAQIKDNAYIQQALQRARALRQANKRFQINPGPDIAAQTTLAGQTCQQMLLNHQMNVVEFGDGTGSIDYWSILWQDIYYDNRSGYYRSPSHSLVMADDPAYDTDIVSPTLDYDEFGQGFRSPGGLTVITVTYSTLYSDANSADTVWGNLWTLDAQGYLDQLVTYWPVGGTMSWTDRYVTIVNSDILTMLSGELVALTFDMFSDRVASYEAVWLDDAQVTLCYTVGAHRLYLPIVIKQPSPAGPVCTPLEPDGVAQRGSTTVGATCNGSFGATDIKDYYALNLSGATNVRLQLTDLPPGTNWDAMVYEDAAGYPLACHIATPGSQNKYKDCPPLSLSKTYFVLVSAGTAPGSGANTYKMSVVPR